MLPYDLEYLFITKKEFENYDVSNFDSNELRTFIHKFLLRSGDVSLNLTKWDVSNITDMSFLFSEAPNLKKVNITGWNTKNVHDMNYMFKNCKFLDEVIGFNTLNTSNVEKMVAMFAGCNKMKRINVTGMNMMKVMEMGDMFCGCYELEEVKGFNTVSFSSLKKMNDVFSCCRKLKSIDFTGLNFENVITISSLFYDCETLEEVKGFETVRFPKVEDIHSLFGQCLNLKKIDLSCFENSTRTIKERYGMFYWCEKLEEVEGLNVIPLGIGNAFVRDLCDCCKNLDYFLTVLPFFINS